MDRGRRLAQVMAAFLPPDFAQAAPLLVRAMGRPHGTWTNTVSPPPVAMCPAVSFTCRTACTSPAKACSICPEALHAQHALTQRLHRRIQPAAVFTTTPRGHLGPLAQWAGDDNAHVRRAVSEATRPRLPWPRVCPILCVTLRPCCLCWPPCATDPSAYVRRSVANHLNDIGKDHPELLTDLARQWLDDAPVPAMRQSLLRHALRTAIKRGDTQALALFGTGK